MFTLVSCVSHSEICGNMWNVVNWWVTGGGSYISSDLTGEIFGIPEFLNLGAGIELVCVSFGSGCSFKIADSFVKKSF